MAKSLYIAEKPSVAQEFARVLKVGGGRRDGFIESEDSVVTWCVGHLVTMSYPEKYDEKYRRWSFETLPFLPSEFLYEVIPAVSISGVKRRCNAGLGRCQGGFCSPRVAAIIARELGIDETEVLEDRAGSKVLVGRMKEDL